MSKMNWKNLHGLIDISPFLLYESAGDSEKDSDLNMSSFDDDNNMEVSCDNEVDDAQSCCSDSSEIFNNDRFKENLNSKKSDQERMHGHEYNPKYRERNEYDELDEDDDDDGVINQYCRSSKKGFVFSRSQKKIKGCVDSKMEPVKKEEKDKLFWDTCLAS